MPSARSLIVDPTDRRSRQAVLADFLRTRREKRTPEAAGLASGGRRRTPGLRREDVAVLAGMSVSYYTWLEQGRDITPSGAVLDGLVAALGLDAAETEYVKLLQSEPVPSAAAGDPAATDLVRRHLASLEPLDEPVYAIDDDGFIVGANAAARRWYGGPVAEPDRGHHFLTWFLSEEARRRVVDWESVTHDVVRRTRLHVARRPIAAGARAVIEDLHAANDRFAVWWDSHDVSLQSDTTRRLRSPDGGRERVFRLLPLRPVAGAGLFVMAHVPV